MGRVNPTRMRQTGRVVEEQGGNDSVTVNRRIWNEMALLHATTYFRTLGRPTFTSSRSKSRSWEHPVVPWHMNDPNLVQRSDGLWHAPESTLPLSFTLRAVRG